MEWIVRKWEDGLGLKIPQPLAIRWGLDETSVVEVIEVEEGLMLRKKTAPATLEDLLTAMPPDFTYPEDVVVFGEDAPQGREWL